MNRDSKSFLPSPIEKTIILFRKWFSDMDYPLAQIREEVEKFNLIYSSLVDNYAPPTEFKILRFTLRNRRGRLFFPIAIMNFYKDRNAGEMFVYLEREERNPSEEFFGTKKACLPYLPRIRKIA